jgi:putative membrane protein
MIIRKTLSAIALTGLLVGPAVAAPTMTARQFVTEAGASDLFERKGGMLMSASSNIAVASFAKKMVTDHTKSTEMVKTAAKADGLTPAPPMMTAKQQSDLAALTASKGAVRDSLYIAQQKAAHAEALDLMKSYSTSGKATHLKDTAGEITPVVQSHMDMLNKMAM